MTIAPPRPRPPVRRRTTSTRPAVGTPTGAGPTGTRPTGGDHRKRGLALLIVSLIILSLFGARLLELQGVRGDALAAAAVDQRQRTVTLLADRGAILDRNGQPLAVSVESRNVTVDQTLVTDAASAAAQLAPLLGMPVADIQARLTGERRFAYVAKKITPETWRKVEELRIPGIFSERTTSRIYPAGPVAANVIGFTGAEGTGLGGLEYALDEQLTGVPGSVTYERGAEGSMIPTAETSRVEPVAGATVRLTIDRDIQFIAQQALDQQVAASGAESGTVVVQTKTGEILALAASPGFDPSNPGAAPEVNRGNRAVTDAFEPGSTSKIMTLAAAIDRGKVDVDTPWDIPATLWRAGKEFHDHDEHGGIRLTTTGVLARSSNIGTILAAETVGPKVLYSYLKRFGVGEKTGIGLPAEATGYVPPTDKWSGTSLPTIAFGQGLSMSAVQVANVYATIANDGVRTRPRVIAEVTGADGSPSMTGDIGEQQVISPETAAKLRQMLETVVSKEGTGSMARIPGYRVGGKTGTAQFVDPSCGCYNGEVIASFAGIAPIDAPELIVSVSIVKPQVGRWGGELGGPVFRTVMSYALQALGVPPTDSPRQLLPVVPGKTP